MDHIIKGMDPDLLLRLQKVEILIKIKSIKETKVEI